MLALRNIHHSFGDNTVLQDVTLQVRSGEVHALLGMNGAGKSTLLQIAAGVLAPQKGTVEIDGREANLKSPADALLKGIVFLTQEVDRGLVPHLSVHENLTAVLLKNERRILFHKSTNRERARALLAQYGLDIDVNRSVSSLSLYEKQMLSIIRAVAGNARYLLLDEPTASFDRKETERFHRIVAKLKEQGIGIVFISHRLHEVFALSDRISVLRGGKLALQKNTGETTLEETVHAMTGSDAGKARRETTRLGPTQFKVDDLRLWKEGPPLSLELKAGEIVVVFGLLGSGKTTLAETLFGVHRAYQPIIKGTERLINGTRSAVRNGIVLIPEERGKQGIWKRHDIRTHLALSFKGWISKRKETAYSREAIEWFTIRPASPSYKVGALSGGNQQKVAIAKWFAADPDVVIFDEPMKGIDVLAKETIFQMIESLAEQKKSILYLTAEPDDALRIADRIVILSRGRIIHQLQASEANAERLLRLAEMEENAYGVR
ncbi:sugar ABC transporter ATP-binding protein [Brevibacillus sp. SYP-B805]|uniref:sugar ABC transporter ATP-binding protein n=1 Tax=Brevibacillus sp. SYP-B805 TaxID=1578199 RepID=UPI0013EE0C92|nr:sugar ABC transporter ATP-binding protein [Brevibacillus sp. SYP-B805]NGQ93582.1 sugar ABC transporter ATP-binding protein [Brevibacillus sp. SYP-B805]